MEGEPGPLRSSEKQGVGHHTQARALWLREKAKTGIVGASNLVEKQVESPRPVKTQKTLYGHKMRHSSRKLEPMLDLSARTPVATRGPVSHALINPFGSSAIAGIARRRNKGETPYSAAKLLEWESTSS